MATKANTVTAATATAGKAAPAPTTQAGNSAQVQATPNAQAQAQGAPLYMVGTLPPVRQGSIRAYAQAQAKALQAQHPKGFTLAAYRAALVANASAGGYVQPKGGWLAHNMPTWCALPAQAWLVPYKAS
jgi:hypothetical protein